MWFLCRQFIRKPQVHDRKFREVTKAGGRALALNEAFYGPSHPQVAYALENLGMADSAILVMLHTW
jgi:hypothetical protein